MGVSRLFTWRDRQWIIFKIYRFNNYVTGILGVAFSFLFGFWLSLERAINQIPKMDLTFEQWLPAFHLILFCLGGALGGVISQYLLSDKTWRPLKVATSSVHALSSHVCSVADIAANNRVLLQAVVKMLTRQDKCESDLGEAELGMIHEYEEIECLPLLPPRMTMMIPRDADCALEDRMRMGPSPVKRVTFGSTTVVFFHEEEAVGK